MNQSVEIHLQSYNDTGVADDNSVDKQELCN